MKTAINIIIGLLILPAFAEMPFDNETEVYVIGTVHYETQNYNSDTLLNILKMIKPDLILLECDSTYMTNDFQLKEDIKSAFLETKAVSQFLVHEKVEIRPYDIAGRDLFLNDTNRLKSQSEFFEKFYSFQEENKLSPYSKFTAEKIFSVIEIADEMSNSTASFINSFKGAELTDTINKYTYEEIRNLIESDSILSEFKSYWDDEYEFWDKRNEAMIENIFKYGKIYKDKRIVVLCGFAHKNIIKRKLLEKSKDGKIIVKEFFE